MKQKLLYNFKLRALMLVAILCAGFTGTAWSQTTVTTTSFSAISGNVGNDSKVTYAAYKGGGTSNPAVNSNAIRLYQNSSGATAGYVVIGVAEGYSITSATIQSTMATTTGYKLTDTDPESSTPEKSTFNVSNYSLSANTDYTVSNISTRYITFACFGTTSGSRLYLSKISITYQSAGGGSSAEATTTTIDASGITNFDVYTSTAAGSLAATVTAGGNAVDGATVTWSGNNDAVATINSSTGAVTLIAAGSVTFTATYAGVAGTYQSSTDTYEMLVTSSAPYVQPTEFEIALNNTLFGTNYNGSASGITDDTPISGTQDNVTVTYAGSGNHYVNNSQIRFYQSNKLTFEAPSGYNITEIVFSAGDTWTATISANAGTYMSGTKTWTGEARSVLFTGSGTGQCRMTGATITLEAESTDPSISADYVNIAYDATGGSFDYTINNPVEGGVVSVDFESDDDWLLTATESNGTVSFTCTANATNAEREAVVQIIYTYNNDVSVTKEVLITQDAAPVIYTTIQAIFDAATSTETDVNVTFNNWVVSGVSTNGKNVFVTDNAGNGFVIFDNNGDLNNTYAVGSILSGTAVTCKLVLYNGFAEIKNLNASDLTISTGGTVTAANVAMANLAGVNTGALVSYQNLTCSVDNNKYYLSDGTTTLQVYNALFAFDALEAGKTYNITGIYEQFNNTKEILPRSAADIEEVEATEPTITLASYSVEATAATGLSGTINVTYDNITTVASDIAFYESDGTTTATYDWITVTINSSDNNVEYLMDENNGAARTAYFKVWAFDDNMNEVYSNLVTVTQAAYVVDYAELPFSYNENGTGNLPAGLTVSGLGTYSNSPRIKFDGTDDYLELKIQGGVPAVLKFDIKGNGSGSDPQSGTFKVQVSTDGTNYEDLAEYKSLSSTTETKTLGIEENIHFIKWIYSDKSVGNVALGNINLSAESIIVGQAGYTTYTTMNNVSFPEGVTAYIATQVNANTIHMETIESAPARTPVVIKAAEGSYTLTSGTSTADVSSNILKSSDGTVTGNESSIYALGKKNDVLGFYLVENGQTVPAGKAYLDVNNGSNVKGFTFDFGTETGIETIAENQEPMANGQIFNLAGQRMSKMQKGINIVNGKKVLVK